MNLKDFFETYPKVAVAFSGGVDSAYLLHEAVRYAESVRAYYVKSAFQPVFELEDAVRFAREEKADLTVLSVDVLQQEEVVSNPQNRCYYCKQVIFSTIRSAALSDGFSVLLDGTNASDQEGDRPGMKALQELQVLSPLRMCGLTKRDIRIRSREAGLFTWDKPAYACLATRIPTGQRITGALLERTEWAEDYLSSLGFRDFRVRTRGDDALIQVTKQQMPLAIKWKDQITEKLSEKYQRVLTDFELRPVDTSMQGQDFGDVI